MAFDDGKKTVSGSIAHTDDAATKVPFVSLKCGIAPTLTGKSAVECTVCGDSVFFPSDIVQGSISGSGYNAESTTRIRTEARKAVSPSTAYHIKCNSEILIYEVHEYQELLGSSTYTTVNATETTITTKATTAYMRILFRYSNNATITPSALKYIQCTTGTLSPYTVSTVNLGRTIYGGTADVVNGTGTDMGAIHTITSENVNELSRLDGHRWYIHNRYIHCITPSTDDADSVVCDKLKSQIGGSVYDNRCFINSNGAIRINTTSEYATNSDFLEDFGGSITFAFILDASYYTDFTFTPITPTPETVGKVNNVYCDTGNTELTYYDNAHGFSEVTVNRTGKNLFGGWTKGYGVNSTTGEIFSRQDSAISDYISVVPNTNYYISGFSDEISSMVAYYDRNKTYISRTSGSQRLSLAVTTPTNCRYMILYQYRAGDQTASIDVIDNMQTQLEFGSEQTEYEPYEVVSKTAYLHKVIYGGQADVVRGTCKNYYSDSVTFDGSNDEVWQKHGSIASWFYIDHYLTGAYANNNENDFIMSSWGSQRKYLNVADIQNGEYAYGVNERFVIKNTSFTEVADFKAWLAQNPITIAYKLATPSTFSFPPISISTDQGENTLFATEGDSAITYRKAVD